MDDLRYWKDVLDCLRSLDAELPKVYPPELPPETEPGFWWDVYRLEIMTRDEVSAWPAAKFQADLPPPNALYSFFVRRRLEWAGQLVVAYVRQSIAPELVGTELFHWLLIESWEKDGCLGLEAHARRDGKAHPENPDGLSPLG